MSYKDKEKQREANRERQRRYTKALPAGVVWESEPDATKKIAEIMFGKAG